MRNEDTLRRRKERRKADILDYDQQYCGVHVYSNIAQAKQDLENIQDGTATGILRTAIGQQATLYKDISKLMDNFQGTEKKPV